VPLVLRVSRALLVGQAVILATLLPMVGLLAGMAVWIATDDETGIGGAGRAALAASLAILAAFLVGCSWLVVAGMRALRRMRVEFHEDRLEATLVRWRGPFPRLPASVVVLPWRKLAALERRDEIFRTWGVPGVHEAWTLVAADGTRFPLGQRRTGFESLPFEAIAAALAARGVAIVEGAPVERGGFWGAMFRRETPMARPASPTTVRRGRRILQVLAQISAVIGLLAVVLQMCAA